MAIFGAPLDAGTTYRPGTRFGPQGIRRATNLFGTYNFELGVDLREQLNLVDIGDVCAIPGNLEKSFDQISKAMGHVVSSGRRSRSCWAVTTPSATRPSAGWRRTWTATSASSTSTGTSTPRSSTSTSGCTPRRGSTPPTSRTPRRTNLVQIGIGGWQAPRAGVKVGRGRGTTIMTVGDVERVGIEKIAETALELAWQGAKAVYLSFDIDVIDSGFVPGTGWPEPGGLLPREALGLVRLVAEGGISGMEVVECSPPYDWAEQTSLISARVVLDALATMVRAASWARRPPPQRTDAWGPYPTKPAPDVPADAQRRLAGEDRARRSRTLVSRMPTGARPKVRSSVALIEVVSYWVGSTRIGSSASTAASRGSGCPGRTRRTPRGSDWWVRAERRDPIGRRTRRRRS